jgi:hypothetical protein
MKQESPTIEVFTDVALSMFGVGLCLGIANMLKQIDPFYINKLDRKIRESAFNLDWGWMVK